MSRELIGYLAGWLVDHPDDVEITEVEGEGDATILEVSVHPDDMGKIIGKRGRIIRSIRTLAKATERNIAVEVVD